MKPVRHWRQRPAVEQPAERMERLEERVAEPERRINVSGQRQSELQAVERDRLGAGALLPLILRRLGSGYFLYTAVVVPLPALTGLQFIGMGRYLLAAFLIYGWQSRCSGPACG